MKFKVISRSSQSNQTDDDTVYLEIDNWNDYSFVTMFYTYYRDTTGTRVELGAVKIGFKGQTTEQSTHSTFTSEFASLDERYFSLGQNTDFYRRIGSLQNRYGISILSALRDIVQHPEIIDEVREESVFSISLLREVPLSLVRGQYLRALDGAAELTDFDFGFTRPESEDMGSISLEFSVGVDSIPSTNIHAVIGRNGVGKTTLLNGMIDAITKLPNLSKFINLRSESHSEIGIDYFSSLVSVSFSAFDPFTPPEEQPDPSRGTCYFYIGLKDRTDPDLNRAGFRGGRLV